MELAYVAFLTLSAVAFGMAGLLGIIWSRVQVRSLIPLALWVSVAGGIFGLMSFGFWTHNWIDENTETPIALPPQPVEPAADIADPQVSPLASIAKIPDAIPENENDEKPTPSSEPIGPPYENPTLPYIVEVISQHRGEERELVIEQFIGTPVSWDGRTAGISVSGKRKSLLLIYGRVTEPWKLPPMFYVRVELPKNKFLLQLPKGSLIHAEGIIETLELGDVPKLRDVTATLLPSSHT